MRSQSNFPVSRRSFAAGLAAASLAGAQQINPAAPAAKSSEPSPFAEPLTFVRRDHTSRVQPFAMPRVELLPGPFRQAADWNRVYMIRISANRLLHTFRLTAGIQSSAEPLGGWEEPKGELRGHFTGHYLSACALRFASAGDQTLKARGDEIVAGLAECQAKLGDTGYLSAYPIEFYDRLDRLEKVWAPFYTLHKIMAGLLDMYVLTGNRQALDVVTGIARWTDEWTGSKSEAHMQDILKTEFGGMSEVLYNLTAVTKDDRWAKVGDRFQKKSFITPLAQNRDQLHGLHANTHIPQVIGAARRYELTSDHRFHDVADYFWYTVASSRTYSTGGSSNKEHYLSEAGNLSLEYKNGRDHQECCCSYNMMKLTRHLYEWTADPRYFDYYERNLLNHRLGTIQPETGLTMYFLSLAPGAWKSLNAEDQSFWCCTGTGVEEYSKLNDSIYYRDANGIYINLFIASELNASEHGAVIRQETRFPQEPRTTIKVQTASSNPWKMRLRIPEWTSSPAVRINGRKLEAISSPGSYLEIERVWKSGDRVEFEMPMHLRTEAMPDDPSLQSFLFGPLVLAGELGSQGLTQQLTRNVHGPNISKAPMEVPSLAVSGKPVGDWLQPVGGEPLTFRTRGQKQDITFRPLNQTWQRYAVYWSVA